MNESDFLAVAEALSGQPHYTATELTGGVSAHSWKLNLDGTHYVCRHSETINLQQEFQLLKEMKSGPVAVPDAVLHNSKRHYLVLTYIHGDVQYHWSRTQLALAAHSLTQIHKQSSAAVPALIQPTQSLFTGSSIFEKALEPLRSKLQTFSIRATNSHVLLHGDYWPGNLIWQEGHLAAVIDWEDAHLGDPLADLATTRIELGWLMDWQASLEFTQRYLDYNLIDTSDLFFWDCVVLDRLIHFVEADLEEIALFFQDHGHPELTAESIIDRFCALIEILAADEPHSSQH